MEIKSHITINIDKNGKIYTFSMPVGAPFGEAYDAAFEVLQKIVELAKSAAQATKLQQDIPADQQ